MFFNSNISNMVAFRVTDTGSVMVSTLDKASFHCLSEHSWYFPTYKSFTAKIFYLEFYTTVPCRWLKPQKTKLCINDETVHSSFIIEDSILNRIFICDIANNSIPLKTITSLVS